MDDEVLDVAEAAALLKVSKKTVYEQAGKTLPACRVGRCWRFSRQSLLEYVRSQTPTPAPTGATIHALLVWCL